MARLFFYKNFSMQREFWALCSGATVQSGFVPLQRHVLWPGSPRGEDNPWDMPTGPWGLKLLCSCIFTTAVWC